MSATIIEKLKPDPYHSLMFEIPYLPRIELSRTTNSTDAIQRTIDFKLTSKDDEIVSTFYTRLIQSYLTPHSCSTFLLEALPSLKYIKGGIV